MKQPPNHPLFKFSLNSPAFRWVARTGSGLICAFAIGQLSFPACAEDNSYNFSDLTIQQLMNESVTSVSKKEISLDQSPAAVSVITQDDIRRLGITSIPEALRLVPGLDVARVGANQWAISSRGFNSQYANKLLVLMDGRSVYTPGFGGVYWNAQDMVLDDLERIEVIRGPGATLWGANAVNGVINITSKNSKATQGWLASTAFGTEDQPSASLRYGGAIGRDFHFRAYVKYFDREGFQGPSGNEIPDSWDSIRGGFRADWEPFKDDLITLQGDLYSIHTKGNVATAPLLTPPFSQTEITENSSEGGNVLGRWTHTFSDKSQLTLQTYFDNFRYESGVGIEERNTFDIQLEHRFPISSWNDIVWGLGYRLNSDQYTNTPSIAFNPTSSDLSLYSAFVQDEITLVPNRLRLTLGSKVEHNDYTGWEIQPSVRLQWTPTEHQTVWAAASHASGMPARVQRTGRVGVSAFQVPFGPVIETALIGNANVGSESLDAYELGYRIAPARNLSLDLVAFYNVYEDLITVAAPGIPQVETSPTPHLLVPLDFANTQSGNTYGGEASVQWKPVDRWRLTANYSLLYMDIHPGTLSKGSPQQQVSLRSYLTLPWNLEFNSFAAYVDSIETEDISGAIRAIPAYIRVDTGFVWSPRESVEIGIWGENLLDNQHPESGSQTTNTITEIPRSVIGKITWHF